MQYSCSQHAYACRRGETPATFVRALLPIFAFLSLNLPLSVFAVICVLMVLVVIVRLQELSERQ